MEPLQAQESENRGEMSVEYKWQKVDDANAGGGAGKLETQKRSPCRARGQLRHPEGAREGSLRAQGGPRRRARGNRLNATMEKGERVEAGRVIGRAALGNGHLALSQPASAIVGAQW